MAEDENVYEFPSVGLSEKELAQLQACVSIAQMGRYPDVRCPHCGEYQWVQPWEKESKCCWNCEESFDVAKNTIHWSEE